MARLGVAVAVALALACCLAGVVEARCNKRRAVVPDHEKFFNHQPLELLSFGQLPTNFSWRDKDGMNWLAPSWNQHIPTYCGSCWLHATLSMIQDRLKIVKNATGPDVMLARQTILNCAPFHGYSEGCNGGDVIDVIRYMKHFGVPDESCQVYAASDYTKYGKKAKECPAEGYCMNCMPLKGEDTCWPVETPIKYFLEAYGQVGKKGPTAELDMMTEIYKRGPIACSMATPEEFDYGLHRGVYVDPYNYTDIDHDVEVVGWGETSDGLKYWEIRNSWGTYWGELGFFKLQRGTNTLHLEEGDCWYVVPTWQDEQDVRAGKKVGTHWGIFPPEEAEKFKPEGHRRPHKKHEHRGKHTEQAAEVLPLKRAQQVALHAA